MDKPAVTSVACIASQANFFSLRQNGIITQSAWVRNSALGSGVLKLIKRVALVYPEAAKRARVQGSVDLEITVDEQGNVTDARVINGHSMLHEEALRAVRQWKYSPTLLNGEPVPVIAPVVVYFKLST